MAPRPCSALFLGESCAVLVPSSEGRERAGAEVLLLFWQRLPGAAGRAGTVPEAAGPRRVPSCSGAFGENNSGYGLLLFPRSC